MSNKEININFKEKIIRKLKDKEYCIVFKRERIFNLKSFTQIKDKKR